MIKSHETKEESMSLPIVVLFERHWDTIPKDVATRLLPDLAAQGYDTLCVEAPQHLTPDELLTRHKEGLNLDSQILSQAEGLLRQRNITTKLSDVSFGELVVWIRQYVSSQRNIEVAEKIKNLPASRLFKGILEEANRQAVLVKGIDINELDSITGIDLSRRIGAIDSNEEYRIKTFSENLAKLQSERRGVIFMCGASHANNLISALRKKDIQVLWYFTHSSKNFDDRMGDIREELKDEFLEGHTHLLQESEVGNFVSKVVDEIDHARYEEEIVDGNSHSRRLSTLFGAECKTFVRAGYYVDALLPADRPDIGQRCRDGSISAHNTVYRGQRHLVIPAINTAEVADRILRLQ